MMKLLKNLGSYLVAWIVVILGLGLILFLAAMLSVADPQGWLRSP